MSVHDAETGDIYVDKQGNLWRIMGVWKEPVVTAMQIEDHDRKQVAGVSGLSWEGWKRIHRPVKPPDLGEQNERTDR